MNRVVYERLQEVARNQSLTAYEDVAALANLDMHFAHDRDEISRILDEISTFEHSQGRPLLSAIVVHKERENFGIPGKGFFTMARRLKRLHPGEDEKNFWRGEVSRVHREWAGRT